MSLKDIFNFEEKFTFRIVEEIIKSKLTSIIDIENNKKHRKTKYFIYISSANILKIN